MAAQRRRRQRHKLRRQRVEAAVTANRRSVRHQVALRAPVLGQRTDLRLSCRVTLRSAAAGGGSVKAGSLFGRSLHDVVAGWSTADCGQHGKVAGPRVARELDGQWCSTGVRRTAADDAAGSLVLAIEGGHRVAMYERPVGRRIRARVAAAEVEATGGGRWGVAVGVGVDDAALGDVRFDEHVLVGPAEGAAAAAGQIAGRVGELRRIIRFLLSEEWISAIKLGHTTIVIRDYICICV